MLYNVLTEIIIDAENREDAIRKVNCLLNINGIYDEPYNYMVHNAEKDENFENLEDLRKHQLLSE